MPGKSKAHTPPKAPLPLPPAARGPANTARAHRPRHVTPEALANLSALERKVLWLSSWTVHNANYVRENRDGLKVGGHQASCASVATLMTALYFHVLRPEDRVAVKPHASPVFHAIQYLLGNQTREQLEQFRSLGGTQSYPSRTKDSDDVDISTGSVGLGVAMTVFSSLVQDYLRLKDLHPPGSRLGRMIAIVGDAELDEGNVYEALFEGWKHDLRNLWWIIDYNRQSLDGTISDQLFQRIISIFETMGWNVVMLKFGKLQQAVFSQEDGEALRDWIVDCPNSLYSALTFKGGPAWRAHLGKDLGHLKGIRRILESHDDTALHRLMTNLAGHDMSAVLDAFNGVADDRPTCFIAYTIKGFGLPFAGHKDNHAGLMNAAQMAEFQKIMQVPKGQEWEPFVGLERPADELKRFLSEVPFRTPRPRRFEAPRIDVPEVLPVPQLGGSVSTQDGFGRILNELARSDTPLARHVITSSPDVTVSTNLGAWVNRRQVFDRHVQPDIFKEEAVASLQNWTMSPQGQHVELGIAENNLFIALAAMGLAGPMFGVRLLPIGTLYDPFISRGLDALNYACYQDARFMVVATPSGISLAPEGGAHQSVLTPLVGIGQPGLASFEPAYVDELAAIMAWGFRHLQADRGGSVYLRLSTRTLEQPKRTMDEALRREVLAGAYWLLPPQPGAALSVVAMGAVLPEALEAMAQIQEDLPGAGLLVVTSADRLHHDWLATGRARIAGHRDALGHAERLLAQLAPGAALVTVLDGHPATLSWLGAVAGNPISPLGVEDFGQSGDIPDLYRHYHIDAEAIVDAAAAASLRRLHAPR
ncbi:MAG: transketolase [Candidatus Lambdaproteobacteria bacterium]|nr:transketolase [Candidatus Lambdaproteobacteria bacterium]